MANGRRRAPAPMRESPQSRGPSGLTVFLVFLVLAALCLGVGFGLGQYLLGTLGSKISETGGSVPGGSVPGGTGSAGGTGGAGGGTVPGGTGGAGGGTGQTGGSTGTGGAGPSPAGGGAGSVTLETTPLTVYAIQVGAFGSRANADKVVADLAAKGYPGWVVEPPGGSGLYKVRTVTVVRKETAETVRSALKSQGYPDAFLAVETIDAAPLKLTGSSVEYLGKVKTALEAVASCLRTEGDIWDADHGGTLDRAAAAKKVDTLVSTVGAAKQGLGSLIAPKDLSALGQAVQSLLTEADGGLRSLKGYLAGQAGADRVRAESSFLELLDAYSRLEAGLGS